MFRVQELVGKAARSNQCVMITGETGTGKEVAAKLIHDLSPRKGQFVAINCANLSEGLIESELFGHERGAFTSAHATRLGIFELADGGTVFLDEITEMKADLQGKFLRVLQERSFRRVGGQKEIGVNARVIAASNRELEEAVSEKRFRKDLYHRLNVLHIPIPPLRERMEDVEELAAHFIQQLNLEEGTAVEGLDSACLSALKAHSWPGNIRELHNVIAHAVVSRRQGLLTSADLPERIHKVPSNPEIVMFPVGTTMDEIKWLSVQRTLHATDGNHVRAARILRIATNTLYSILRKGVPPG